MTNCNLLTELSTYKKP